MKKIVALMLALVMVFALAACGSKPAAPAADAKPVLVMGTSADYAPFEFMYPDEKGNLVYGGIDVDAEGGEEIGDGGGVGAGAHGR